MLRIRSDDQLVALFREGSDDAFRVIHDRYRSRLHAYTRQMLAGSPHDSEDALQEIFVRAYYGLRANQRDLALRPWLYRVAHNRCVDELRRVPLLPLDPDVAGAGHELDPAARVEQRDALRRLIADVQRLPDQQRSALLMRELSGMSYNDVAASLGVSVAAVKSLLVRARVGLAQANEARDTACGQIREELIVAHDRGVRASGLARRHMTECDGCRTFRREMRGQSRQLAALVPTLGPVGVIAQLLGIGGGGGAAASSGAGGVAAAGGVAGGAGAAASAGLLAGGAGHVVSLIAAAVVTAGGAVELQKSIIAPAPHHVRHHAVARAGRDLELAPATSGTASSTVLPGTTTGSATAAAAGVAAAVSTPPPGSPSAPGHNTAPVSLTQILDPDHLLYLGSGLTGTATTTPVTGVTAPGPASSTASGATTPAPSGATVPPITSGTGSADPSATGTQSTSSGSAAGSSSTGSPSAPGSASSASTPSSSSSSVGTSASASTGDSSSSGTPAAATQGSSAPAAASGSSSSASSPSTVTSSGNTGSGSTTMVRPRTKVARTVAAGSALSGRVVSFVVTRRHAPHHYALGTLAAP